MAQAIGPAIGQPMVHPTGGSNGHSTPLHYWGYGGLFLGGYDQIQVTVCYGDWNWR